MLRIVPRLIRVCRGTVAWPDYTDSTKRRDLRRDGAAVVARMTLQVATIHANVLKGQT